jgi:hypothetical protein
MAATNGNKLQPSDNYHLSDQKAHVITLLVVGQTVTAAAQAAGIDRATIWRWSNNDPTFQAALNHARADARRAWQDKAAALTTRALEVVEEALEAADDRTRLRAALAILATVRAAGPEPGSPDPDTLAGAMAHKAIFDSFGL